MAESRVEVRIESRVEIRVEIIAERRQDQTSKTRIQMVAEAVHNFGRLVANSVSWHWHGTCRDTQNCAAVAP